MGCCAVIGWPKAQGQMGDFSAVLVSSSFLSSPPPSFFPSLILIVLFSPSLFFLFFLFLLHHQFLFFYIVFPSFPPFPLFPSSSFLSILILSTFLVFNSFLFPLLPSFLPSVLPHLLFTFYMISYKKDIYIIQIKFLYRTYLKITTVLHRHEEEEEDRTGVNKRKLSRLEGGKEAKGGEVRREEEKDGGHKNTRWLLTCWIYLLVTP